MKNSTFLSLVLCLVSFSPFAQNIYDARQSVIIEATVQENPPKVTLNWVLDTANGGYKVWRKAKSDLLWGDSVAVLGPGSTFWVDTTVTMGIGYEYQVIKSLPAFPYGNGTPNFGAGYVYSGIKVPPTHHRGACLVVVDSTFKYTLATEISRLLTDIEGDGWLVQTRYVDRNDPVPTVKSYIKSWSETNPDKQQSVFLFGRVPVPYSGEIAPDGHHNDHRGAWPRDGYYAELEGVWTDQTVNINSPGTRHDNVPGDGKFDNNVFPAPLKLQLGRVDFANMTKFPESEEQLLRRYLNKDHAWRTGKMPMVERGLIDNNFQDIEALGQTGWNNFAAMFGISKVKDLPYRQTLSNQSFMWSYGCGGGGPESASDISSTTNFTTDSLQTAFTLLFGSYFGDWDYPNAFLRAAIASRTCLASTWANRPNWVFHHMALGESIGYSAKTTMSNTGLYTPPYYGIFVHNALLGDPTIRMHVLPPVENLSAHQAGIHVQLSWQDPAHALGYFIYKKTATDTAYLLLNQVPITDMTYFDACPDSGLISYMVRSVELRTSASGTYYNLSNGAMVSFMNDPSAWVFDPVITMSNAGQSNGSVSINPQGGCPPYHFEWNTGETTAEIHGLDAGAYCATVSDCLECSVSYCAIVEDVSNLKGLPSLMHSRIFTNTVGEKLVLELQLNNPQDLQLEILDAWGRSMGSQKCSSKDIHLEWEVPFLAAGFYWLRIESAHTVVTYPFAKAGG
ncbi:MAG: SprB repeat-containing protein [Saprospiraceae bacterium]